MFDIHCDACGHRYLVGTRSITAFENTADGPVATVRCPRGHVVVHAFRPAPVAARPVTRSAA
jgi:hypothetical protein